MNQVINKFMNKNKLEELYREYRPAIHFSCKRGWMNDPNGLIFHEGWYHLYYQHYPDGVIHGPMHWGHARTKDFLEWEELPVALSPDEKGMIFSGCMVYDKENTTGFGTMEDPPLVAVFTQHIETKETSTQYQSLAFSTDAGMTFQKYEGNPVLDLKLKDFRDPKVFWHPEERKWIMLTAVEQEIRFFTSGNLKQWAEGAVFRANGLKPDVIWECPDLVEMPDDQGGKQWVLFVSQNTLDYAETGIRYFVGTFDGCSFCAEEGAEEELLVDFGRDNYAAATYAEVKGRVIQQSWMNCWAYAMKLPGEGFRGSMTLPRELGLRKTIEGYRLIQRPVREALEELSLYIQMIEENSEVFIDNIPGIYRIRPEKDIVKITFENNESSLEIDVDFVHGKIAVDRSSLADASYGSCFQEIGRTCFQSRDNREIYMILDVTSIEIFAADGEAVGTFQYFTRTPFQRIRTGE